MKSQLLPPVNLGRHHAHGHTLTTTLSNQELQQNVFLQNPMSVPCKVENCENPALSIPGRHKHIGLIWYKTKE